MASAVVAAPAAEMPVASGDPVSYSPAAAAAEAEFEATGPREQAAALAEATRCAFRALEGPALEQFVARQPLSLLARSEDGRGPLFWAWEARNAGALQLLACLGFDILSDETDAEGIAPWTLGGEQWQRLAEDACQIAAVTESKTLYIMRHGFSESQEAERKLKGLRRDPRFRDAPLHADGIVQAKNLRAAASEWNVEAVLCSPLRRALHTAALVFGAEAQAQSWWHKIAEEPRRPPLELSELLREFPPDRPENIGVPLQELRSWLRVVAVPEPANLQEFCGRPRELWDPEREWALFQKLSVPHTRADAQYSLKELQEFVTRQLPKFFGEVLQRQEQVLALVSHYGALNRLLQAAVGFRPNLANCGAVRLRITRTASGWLCGPPEPL